MNFQPQLRLLACGHDLWSDAVELEAMQRYVRQYYIAFPSNNQLTERWVKDSNECTHSGKDDHIASLIAVCRSATVFEYKYEAKQLAKENFYVVTSTTLLVSLAQGYV